ncbi:MAG TPA: hypothetical protein VFW50_24380 [Streptosporangiaceae bacterium]|nr:hypothetical protein [Streptosporangiaceae bacterium]
MRLGLFDRIRRLARSRRPKAGPPSGASGTQGRHRRGRRRGPPVPPLVPPPPAPVPGSPGSPGFPGPESPGGAELARDVAPGPASGPAGPPADRVPPASWSRREAGPSRREAGPPSVRAGAARARIREAPADAAAIGAGEAARPVPAASGPRARWAEAVQPAQAEAAAAARSAGLARVAAGVPRQPDGLGRPSGRPAMAVSHAGLPFAPAHPRERPRVADGRRNCGSLEAILWRQWDPASPPPREVVAAVDRLAELPMRIKEKLAAGLDAIFVGPGGVPELDDMTSLRGVPLPAGRATWDACAGAYGERKIVVGSRPSPTPDVMCHEVGHALDDLDSPPGKWQSDSPEFRLLYDQCQPNFASDFHRQPGGLGRKEFFADAFSAIASRQRPALVDMLSGDTRTALQVMLYFNRRYGI